MDRDRSAGTLSPDGSLPGSRIAPNPILLTVRSPSSHVPAAAALITGEFTRPGYAVRLGQDRLVKPCTTRFRGNARAAVTVAG